MIEAHKERMMQFKVGDRVRVLIDSPDCSCWSEGYIGIVTETDNRTNRVRLDDTFGGWISAVVGVDAEYADQADHPAEEYTGSSVNYYRVKVESPTSPDVAPYEAECNDIIEALGMNYAEGNAFKAIWRSCAARQGKAKRGYDDGLYDAEKVVFFGQRMVAQAKGEK